MGLDMFLEGRKYLMTDDETEDGYKVVRKSLELGYWRKHPNLHGYIVQEFAGGLDECQDIELDQEGIVNIIAAIKERKLPTTQGFFFGASDDSDEQIGEDLGVFTKALLWLQVEEQHCIRSVVYKASW